jgi:type I restriction enzyme, S subunit
MQPPLSYTEETELSTDCYDLPDGWQYTPLFKVITRIEAGTSVNSEDRPAQNSEIGVLKTSCISAGRFLPNENKVVTTTDIPRVRTSVKAGTVIISRASGSPELVGTCAYIEQTIPNLYHSDKLWQVHFEKMALSKYMGYLLSSSDIQNQMSILASGSQTMRNLSQSRLLGLSIPLPPLPEQASIVNILDAADATVRTTASLINAKLRYKRTLSERLLTEKHRFPEFKGQVWREVSLGEFLSEKSERFPVNEIPVVLSCSKLYGILPQSERFSKPLASHDLRRYKFVEPGNLVFDPMLLWDASIAFSELRGVVSPAYCTLRFTSDEADRRFFHALLFTATMRHNYKAISKGTNARRKKVLASDFLKVKVRIPAPAEQRKIAKVLGLVDEEIALLRRELEALKRQKQGLMQQLLTGKVRVKEFAT